VSAPQSMLSDVPFGAWFTLHWMRAGLVLAGVLLLLTPVLVHEVRPVIVLAYLQLPLYLLHQYEEHADGAFQRYVTRALGGGREVLDARAVLWINVGLVWGLDLLWLLLAVFVHPGWGMVAAAMAVVNGAAHVVDAVRFRRVNPGLWTAALLFLPLGGAALWGTAVLAQVPPVGWLLALLAAALAHLPVLVSVRRRR